MQIRQPALSRLGGRNGEEEQNFVMRWGGRVGKVELVNRNIPLQIWEEGVGPAEGAACTAIHSCTPLLVKGYLLC